jgi:hypothetical protein
MARRRLRSYFMRFSGVGWMGVDIALLVLRVNARTTSIAIAWGLHSCAPNKESQDGKEPEVPCLLVLN